MAFQGFGKASGPSAPPNSSTPFGTFPRPPSPSPPQPFPVQRFPRASEAIVRPRSPPLAFGSNANNYASSSVYPLAKVATTASETPDSMRSPPKASASIRPTTNFSSQSAALYRATEFPPTTRDNGEKYIAKGNDAQNYKRPSAVTSFVASRNSGTSVTATVTRSQDFKGNRSTPLLPKDFLSNSNQVMTRSHSIAGDVNQSHIFPLRAQPSPFVSESNSYVEKHSSFGEAQRHSDMLVNNHNRPGSQITQSPPAAFVNNHFDEHFPPLGEARRPAVSSAWGGRPKLQGNNSDLVAHENLSMVSSYGSSYDSRMSSLNQPADLHGQKRNRSPPMQPVNGFHGYSQSSQDDTKRPSVSPPRLSTRSNLSSSNSQSHRRSLQSLPKFDVEPAATKPASSSLPKRTRSPPLLSAEQSWQGNSSQDDTEREMQAKAKRLQRFKTELSETVQNSSDIADQNMSTIRSGRSTIDRGKPVAEFSSDAAGDFSNDNADNEGMELSNVITGLCPDMCPESERAERERKGDLDQYERIDGDRNQTSKSLAIKKYTRTAEREASLIRPMPILQKTIDYLLNLLDQPYNDKFLGLYNFLWDRMRAIRMDLRMQHIFNRGAITMLEQMIRLHIIAMHELCEYTKGEGFSEGFDAHLNIEQMNKTSVELFQMYDDHRKKGINVPTEKEFRGYYALLKLDKHPGYKVEPAELSLDLAKMTPEIRQTSDVLFARDVARACRTGNFIAFFRLARKATYLQACLMHAHFSKLRTQALASLHCGVQINQGLPVSHVANWLGMEEEDIESLLEYHGFVVKEFEEPYIVKEGPFINVDTDYPTKCSKLVHLKKSRCIADDVLAACLVASLPTEEDQEINLDEICNPDQKTSVSVERDSYVRVDEEMKDFETRASPKGGSQVQPVFGTTVIGQQSKADRQMDGVSNLQWDFSFPHSSPLFQPVKAKTVEEPNVDVLFSKSSEKIMHFGKEEIPLQIVMSTTQQDTSPSKIVLRTTQQDISPSNIVPRKTQQDISPNAQINFTVESSAPLSLAGSSIKDKDAAKINDDDDDDDDDDDECMENQDEEVVEAKLKLILRLWKRRSSRQRELREQRQLAANAALNSLSLGPPIRLSKDQHNIVGEFDIDHVMRERYKKHERSCSRLNVSDVVASVLSRRNPDARCLCWKLVVCSQLNNLEGEVQNSCQVAHMTAGPWLHSKLMPANIDDDDLVISSPGLSLWKKWIPSSSDADHTCCLSVIKDANLDDLNKTVSGASGVLFLVSEHLPWELQKIQLHNLVMSLPSASCLPLLILSSSYSEDVSDPSSNIVNKLGVHEIDKSRVSSYMVVHLVGNQLMEQSDGFLSDERLREGLKWLAGESPPQPSLDCVKTRALIFAHLSSSLELLDEMCDNDISPEHCITAFNAALDQSKLEVDGAAKANATCWPCPEVGLLDEFSDERRVANLYLPSIGWSHAARVEPLMCALNDCKLPNFPNISWLNRGSNGGNEIENQRLELENCLIRYLTETTNMMGFALAKNEASVMLQKSARLELRNSTYYIVPSWVKIFRRIYNWRLASVSRGDLSSAYVSEERERVGASISLGLTTDKLGPKSQGSFSSLHHFNQPGLDEMVEVSCCSPIYPHNEDLAATAAAPLALTRNVDDATECGNNDESRSIEVVKNNASYVVNNCLSNNVSVGTQETEKLSKLLEQCNILQDMIDQKLSIYF